MSQEETTPLWSFVPLEEYSVPAAPAAERVRSGFGRLWGRLRGSDATRRRRRPGQARAALPRSARRSRTVAELERSRAGPGCGSGAVGGGWRRTRRQRPCRRRPIGRSSRRGRQRLGQLPAVAHRAAPHATEQILTGGEDWLAGMADDETPRALTRSRPVLPASSRRAGARGATDRSPASSRGPVLVGCGSWSWAYLTRALEVDVVLGRPLALQALDDRRLRDWFGQLAAGRFEFRQSGERRVDRRRRRTPPGEPSPRRRRRRRPRLPATAGGLQPRVFLSWPGRDGATVSAWKVKAPRTRPEERRRSGCPPGRSWIFPAHPEPHGPCELAVLHELLLQGSTTAELLAHLLPYSMAEVTNSLHALRKSRLLENEPHGWRVTRLGYPAARECLHEAGYLAGAI